MLTMRMAKLLGSQAASSERSAIHFGKGRRRSIRAPALFHRFSARDHGLPTGSRRGTVWCRGKNKGSRKRLEGLERGSECLPFEPNDFSLSLSLSTRHNKYYSRVNSKAVTGRISRSAAEEAKNLQGCIE